MVTAVVGANWGDEGKGKITDMLAEKADIIVRFQGGANAGHTIVNDYGKFALHTLPSGVFYGHTTSIIGNGVALNIPVFFKEYNEVVSRGVPAPKILISNRAQMVMSYHILFDQYEEERLGGKAFGSTKSGIAPFYSDKYAKIGFQVSELFDEEALKEKVARICETKNVTLEHLYHKPLLKPEDIMNELMEYKKMVEPYVCDVSLYLWNALKEGKWDNLFDGDKSTCNHTSESQLPIPHQFSFKSEVPVKLRHIRIFHRDIWPFRDATPRVFEIWATNSLPNPDGSDDGWVLLNTFTSEKPSGLPMGQETQDDINVATKTGEEFTCFVDEEYQYFRFKLIDSYDGQPRMCFAELEIYGEPHGYVAEEEADDTEQ